MKAVLEGFAKLYRIASAHSFRSKQIVCDGHKGSYRPPRAFPERSGRPPHWRVVTKRCGEARRPETSSLSSRQSLCWWRRLCHDRFVTWLSLDVQGAPRPTHHLRQTTRCAPFPKETMPSTTCHSPAMPRNRALVKVLAGAGLAARGVLSAALPFFQI